MKARRRSHHPEVSYHKFDIAFLSFEWFVHLDIGPSFEMSVTGKREEEESSSEGRESTLYSTVQYSRKRERVR